MIDEKKLKKLRMQSGKTQKEMADYLHVHLNTYLNYERGLRSPDPDELKRLADFYNVPIEYLYKDSKGLSADGYLVALSGKSITELTDDQKAAVKQVIDTFLQSNANKGE